MKRIWKFKYDMYDIQSWLYLQWENPKIPTFNSSDRVALKTTTTTISLKSGTYPLVILTICFLYWVKNIRCNICVELHISLNKHATVVIFLSQLTARQWINAFPKFKTFTVFLPSQMKMFYIAVNWISAGFGLFLTGIFWNIVEKITLWMR